MVEGSTREEKLTSLPRRADKFVNLLANEFPRLSRALCSFSCSSMISIIASLLICSSAQAVQEASASLFSVSCEAQIAATARGR